ncbi:response regulator [Sediminibacterium sp.]|uniref:response regulator n=1 Tax=Sediminibacterium sp. TaxID=1917865 RepID=UPI003F69B7D5
MYLIGIIEDDVQLRKTMENYISLQQDMSLVFSCNRIEKWISIRQDAGIVPDCVLLDIGLPGISGLDAISIISSYYPGVKILVISGMEDPLIAWQAMMNGANGFLLKPFRLAEMQKQIEVLKSGGTVLDPETMTGLIQTARTRFNSNGSADRFHEFGLTQREIQVAELLVAGSSYKEISTILNVSYTTVNEHIKNIYKKVKVNSKMAFINRLSGKN